MRCGANPFTGSLSRPEVSIRLPASHTGVVGGVARSSRVFVPDVRDELRYLRVTWHPDRRVVVLSHWRDDVCLASTPIEFSEISRLVGFLVGAIEDAATPGAQVAAGGG